MVKFVVVTGGSVSGLGKGTLASSVGVVLRSCGYRVTAVKIDPYLNVDAGTIAPGEHGEVFVLHDGHEGDLDLGNYERALDISLTKDHNVTTGKIYRKIIQAERNGDYLGATVQMVPHVTDAIQEWINRISRGSVDGLEGPPEVCLLEVGGTVGDIESSVYLEALQQFFSRLDRSDYCLCHIVFIPQIGSEQKTKCAQHSFKSLREAGLAADFILGRSETMLEPGTKRKLSVFGGIKETHVLGLPQVESGYYVPELLANQNFAALLTQRLQLLTENPKSELTFYGNMKPVDVWREMGIRLRHLKGQEPVRIGFVAKYIGSNDTYLSVVRAVEHSATECMVNAKLVWIKSELLVLDSKENAKYGQEAGQEAHPEDRARQGHKGDQADGDQADGDQADGDQARDSQAAQYEGGESARRLCKEEWAKLKSCAGVLIPGGFGERGTEGMIAACRYAREARKPYLGICLGMQLACVEAVRTFLQRPLANSEEFGALGEDRVVIFMPETVNKVMGGTMRLGNRITRFDTGDSLATKIYDGAAKVVERHRHRYEFNVDFYHELAEHGYHFVGKDDTGDRLEVLEIPNHPFFLGVQYHPELTSKPGRPNPCFLAFVLACADKLQARFDKYHSTLQPGAEFFN
ncbi:CTP synthase [Gregarina niphandrodes]|uniref:CTP synthase n=1 Tax=Gregarina niphandrodes TaxID=110365 RepID=A0A023B360_GRENI|nr:CTP synthase [Gregarina niphandrodes]EZG55366.1 CTP synthase [Gregarina niphandrodes]|eukprot:XP_011131613.1 CTP synthase [Gregarina niphandrodes]